MSAHSGGTQTVGGELAWSAIMDAETRSGRGGVNNDGSVLQHNRSKQAINEKSYADKLKTNVRYDQRLKRNILEIILEKTNNDAAINNVGHEDIARVLKTLAIDLVSQFQGYQVHYKGRISVISV